MALQSELDKYTRNFVLKSLQVIVQSRMGEKCKYTVKEKSSLEWFQTLRKEHQEDKLKDCLTFKKYVTPLFTIPIPDIPELTAVARKTLGSGPVLAQPVNVEISLKTKENNAYIFLEVWSLSLDVDHRDPDVKVSSTLYGRMTSALKSIISVSRLAPAYLLSQRQKKDDFQIHYQYNVGPPNLGILMDDIKTRRIGAVATPMGTIRVTVSYTEKLQMPQQPRPGIPLYPKIDHFSEPRLGQISEPKPCNRKFRNPTSVEDLRNLESQEKQDTFNSTFSTSPPEGTMCSMSPPPPPLPQIEEASTTLADSVDGQEKQKSPDRNPLDTYHLSAFLHGDGEPVAVEKPEDRPFANLMAGLPLPGADSSVDEDASDASLQEEEEGAKRDGEGPSKEGSEGSEGAEEEEETRSDSPNSSSFVMLPPLESPFRDTDPTTDLGQFYHEMQLAPMAQLSMCEEHTVSMDELLADIKGQIEEYSAKQPDFDKFVRSICKDKDELSD